MLDARLSSTMYSRAPMMRGMALSDRMKEIMGAKNWTQAELARQAGVTRSLVNQWVTTREVTTIGYEIAHTLQRTSGFSLHWIITGEGIKANGKPFAVVGSQKPRAEIDLDLLTSAIGGVESHLRNQRRSAAPPEKKARLIALVYDYYISAGKVEPGAVTRILRLVG